MDPEAIGRSYDQIAAKWQDFPNKSYGIAAYERAIKFSKKSRPRPRYRLRQPRPHDQICFSSTASSPKASTSPPR